VSGEIVLRVAAAAGALFLAGRAASRAVPAFAGALAVLAVLGPARAAFPGPAEAAALAGGTAVLLALGTRREFPAITEDAAEVAALMAAGGVLVALAAGRRLPGPASAVLATLVVLAVSAFAAESCRAAGEAGWREGLGRALGVALPAALGASLAALAGPDGRAYAGWAVALGLAASCAVWVPAILAESARVRRELGEEVALGLLSGEEAGALRFPWTRRLEKDFGSPDERREYVKSALLLVAARHQQRRRRGEAVRLRQLEVLTFRTRLRRTQEARASRFRRGESGEFVREAPPPGAPEGP
jgi:hypothetical protein